jgi:hypothetical protein
MTPLEKLEEPGGVCIRSACRRLHNFSSWCRNPAGLRSIVLVPLAAGRWMPATRKDAGGVACHEHGPWRGSRVRGGRADLLEAGPVPSDGLGGVLGQVMPQLPAVSDLDRAGGPSQAPSAWAPARQHVDGSPGGSAGQDRGADVAAAQREVTGAGHVRRRTGHRIGQAEDQPQQRAGVHRDTQRSDQPHPGPLHQLQCDLGQ